MTPFIAYWLSNKESEISIAIIAQIMAKLMITKILFKSLILSKFQSASSQSAGSGGGGHGSAPPGFKVNILESVDRIKEEFNFMQSQYHKYVNLDVLIYIYIYIT